MGRFISRDPAGFIDGLNLYAYVGNDPVNFVDPFGLSGGAIEEIIVEAPRLESSGSGAGFVPGGFALIHFVYDLAAALGDAGTPASESDPKQCEVSEDSQNPDLAELALQNGQEGLDLSRPANAEHLIAIHHGAGHSLAVTEFVTSNMWDDVDPNLTLPLVTSAASVVAFVHIHQSSHHVLGHSRRDNIGIHGIFGGTNPNWDFPNLRASFVVDRKGNIHELPWQRTNTLFGPLVREVTVGNVKDCGK